MLAVTTRNYLRSARFCVPMLHARLLIARQLARTPGLVRYASALASPTEFLTLTIWEDKEAMHAFMRSGAHARLMWHFTRWTSSFWAARWEPSEDELGAWAGLRLAARSSTPPPVSPLVAVGLLPSETPLAGPTRPRPRSVTVEPRACGLFCATARLEGARTLTAIRAARHRLDVEAARNPDLVRWTVGLDVPPQALVVSLWRDRPAARARVFEVLGCTLGASWVMCWQPGDYEIGHWNGLRLRQAARRLQSTIGFHTK